MRVAVIGAGIGGLTAAAALRANGIDVIVYEKAHELREVGAGVVVATGSDVTSLQEGQRVAWCAAPGSYAELVAVPASKAVPVPDAVDDAVAEVLDGWLRLPWR